jgi:hypothetical protein
VSLVCVLDASNEDGSESSLRAKWKLCKVQLCRRGGKLLVKEARSFFGKGKDEGTVDTEVETLASKAYVVVSARRWVQGYRVWDEVVAGMENLDRVDNVQPLVECATKLMTVKRFCGGGTGGIPISVSEADVRCEGWSCVDGVQAFEQQRSLGKNEFFHFHWYCGGGSSM